MSHLIRIIVLVTFAAVGLAVAIGLATAPPDFLEQALARFSSLDSQVGLSNVVAEPPKLEARDAAIEASGELDAEASTTVTAAPSGERAPTPASPRAGYSGETSALAEPTVSLLTSREPVVAEHRPPVADQIEQLEQAIQRQGETLEAFGQRLPRVAQLTPELAGSEAAADDSLSDAIELPQPSHGGTVPLEGEAAFPSTTDTGRTPAVGSASGVAEIHSEGDNLLELNVQDADIRQVLDLLSKQGRLNILASESVQGKVSASLSGVDVMTALDAILRSNGYVMRREDTFIFVGRPQDFQNMDMAMDKIATRIYRPNYVTAAELQGLITPLLTPGVGTVSLSTAALQGIPADSVSAGGDDFANPEVLIIRDLEGVLAQVDQIVMEVDTRPLQVSIQAMILSVKLDDSLEFGVDFNFLSNNGDLRIISGTPPSSLANMSIDEGGLKVGFIDGNISAFLNALETVGDTNVVASPRLMCLNKQRAEILIGRQLGYVSTTVTENAATQSVEFLEVGTQLRLRPYVSPDGMIRLEVHPELSTGNVRIEEGFTLPDKDLTQVTTDVMCHDGATIVIGGLIREDLSTNSSQIPVLGSLPLAGVVFRQKKEDIDRREIIVLITPRIVFADYAACEGDQAECEFMQRQAIYADKMSPISKRYYGRRYTRLAQAAWQAGRARAALRYVNLAVHFDPLSREALDLRSQIIASSPYGDRTVDSHLREGLAPWQHPVGAHRMHNWVIEEPYQTPPVIGPECFNPAAMIPDGMIDEFEEIEPTQAEPILQDTAPTLP